MTNDCAVKVLYTEAAIALEIDSISNSITPYIQDWEDKDRLHILGGSESCLVFDAIGDNEVIKITRCRATIELFKRLRNTPVPGLPVVYDYFGKCAWTGKHKQDMHAFSMQKYTLNVSKGDHLYVPAGDLRMQVSESDPQCAASSLQQLKVARKKCANQIRALKWHAAADSLATFLETFKKEPFVIDIPIDNWFLDNGQMVNVDPVATAD